VDKNLTILRTPFVSPLEITSVEHVQTRRRRSYRVRKSQKKGIPKIITPLSTKTQVEEVKDSPSPEVLQGSKGKEPQGEKETT